MPPKRPRRASTTAQGLSAGERLKRAKFSGHDQLAWAWVGSEATSTAHITQEHRLATCGFSDSSAFPFCPNKYRKDTVKQNSQAKATKVAGELDDDIIVVSDGETSACSAKACKNNPNCLNYLGQEQWENEEKAWDAYLKAAELGTDPNNESRAENLPVGLKNLGATCYANAFLQVWFRDIPFRTGVYNCQHSQQGTLEDSPIFQLQVTFAAMQSSKQSAFNPVKLMESLKLRTTEQQDAQEFSKLFMAHLDSEFQKQSNPHLRSLIADQFQGKQIYATTCSRCHNRSERENEFLEIEVNLTNNAKLEERIAAILKSETLNGDNKYFCSHCNGLQDAQRQTEFTELPPVLHFSLLRFVYDLTTMERKKSKQLISFPPTLDMGQFLTTRGNGEGSPDASSRYHLRGVLQHKGPSAYHGHYEAQVFDFETQRWYQFNDELVTEIDTLIPATKTQPKSGQHGSQQSAKSSKSQVKAKASNTKKKPMKVDSDIEILEDVSSDLAPFHPTEAHNRISSRDAYMLIYVRSTNDETGTIGSTTVAQPNGEDSRQDTTKSQPPQRALTVVDEINEKHIQSCDDYARRREELHAQFHRIRRKMRDVYEVWQLSSNAESNVVLGRKALQEWLTRLLTPRSKEETTTNSNKMEVGSSPVTISNGDIACEHGKLNPGQVSNMKRVSKAGYDRIRIEHACEFDPVFRTWDVCEKCVQESFSERLYQIEHPRMVSLFDDICPVADDQRGYWISKHWLKDWRLAKPKMHSGSQGDPPPDDSEYGSHVRCEHGGLSVNNMSRKRISIQAYELLKTIFPDWSTLSTDDEQCAVCEALLHISKQDKRGARIQAEEEKAKLKHVHDNALTGATKLLEHVPCAIIPAQFVRTWKQWLFRPAELQRPENVDSSRFICDHGLLALDPNCASDLDTSIAVITRSDWDILEGLYKCGPLIALEHDGNQWTVDLDICEDCRKERKSSFDMTELTIRILRTQDPDPTTKSHAAKTSEEQPLQKTLITYGSRLTGPIRQSRRIRQVKEAGLKRKVTVTRNMSLKDLKVQIQEELSIPTISQRLYYQGLELNDNEATIGSLGVLANDSMDLREQVEDADLLDPDSEIEPRRGREEGQGFGGTLLGNAGRTSSTPHSSQQEDGPGPDHSGRSCPACTFENEPDAVACAMCETLLGVP